MKHISAFSSPLRFICTNGCGAECVFATLREAFLRGVLLGRRASSHSQRLWPSPKILTARFDIDDFPGIEDIVRIQRAFHFPHDFHARRAGDFFEKLFLR